MAPYDAPAEPSKPKGALKLSDAEIVAAVEQEESQCIDGRSGELREERADALARYRGLPLGNEVEGRSQVVDKSILDTIEWIMPSLIRVFLGGDSIGQFQARGPEDEEPAKRETEVCDWYITEKNDIFSQINATLRDALLLKNGYCVGYWRKNYDQMTETYTGMSDEEATMLASDPEIEVLEHSQYPIAQAMPGQDPSLPGGAMPPPVPMLHDIKVERKKCDEFVAVESVPPDEMLVSRRHRWTSLLDADFMQWRRRVTIGQLRGEGFKISDDEPEDTNWDQERLSRERYDDATTDQDETTDPARRIVLFKDTYMRIDLRGKGTTQLWRICIIDGNDQPVLIEEADVVPFAAFSPIIYPHSHIGSSVYDLINDLSVIRTTLLRQYLDGVYLANSGEVAVDEDRANLDDLLISRPGGIKRGSGNPSEWYLPIQHADVTPAVLNGLEYIDSIKEQRTGVSRNTAGLDPNTLNHTATGTQMIQSAANQRIELIARTLASGFRDLYMIVHALALKHSTKPLQIKLKGDWVAVNPREWTRRTDFTIDVGLGVGTPDAQLAKLMGMMPLMGQAQQMGLAGVEQAYNFGTEIWKAAGYKNPQKFLKPPQKDPQTGQVQEPPPPPNPIVQAEQIKQQGLQGKAQMEMQMHGQTLQAESQAKMAQMQMQDAHAQRQAQAQLALQQSNDQRQSQLDQQKAVLAKEQFEAEQASKERIAIRLAEISMAQALEVERIKQGFDDGLKATKDAMAQAGMSAQDIVNTMAGVAQQMTAAVQGFGQVATQHAQAMQQHAALVSAPKVIVRHPVTGRAIGLAPGNPNGTAH